jgi:hypothetical protein
LAATAVTPGKCFLRFLIFAKGPRELLDGNSEIAEFCVPHVGKMSLHADMGAAKSTIAKVRCLEKDYKVRVVLAHDVSWMGEKADDVLLSLLDSQLTTSRGRIMQGDRP